MEKKTDLRRLGDVTELVSGKEKGVPPWLIRPLKKEVPRGTTICDQEFATGV